MLPNRQTKRLKNYHYASEGYYFVTICSYNRECIFGGIISNCLHLNNNGQIVDQAVKSLPDHYPGIKIDKYVIMPNHVHIIVKIVGAGSSRLCNETNNHDNRHDNDAGRENPAPTTLGQIIAYFKYNSTKQLNKLKNGKIEKIWQRNYFDHIIRNETSLNQIREYIINNPLTWNRDENNLNT